MDAEGVIHMKRFRSFLLEALRPTETEEGYHHLETYLTFRLPQMILERTLLAPSPHDELSQRLHATTTADMPKDDVHHLKGYTRWSARLNKDLIQQRDLEPASKNIHEAIMRNAKSIGHKVTLYSGTGPHDFSKLAMMSRDAVLHCPAHISATHDRNIADEFAFHGAKTAKHMIAIHMKPSDKALHVSRISASPDEHETIVPAGTRLKYSHTEEASMSNPNFEGKPVKVHHFTIHEQVAPC
jgi:hypothetical protein